VFSEEPPAFSNVLRNFLTGSGSAALRHVKRAKEKCLISCISYVKSVHWHAVALPFRRTVFCTHPKEPQMSKTAAPPEPDRVEDEGFVASTNQLLALLFLAEKSPHRQFNTKELALITGLSRTTISQIKNVTDTPFSAGKCTPRRLDNWLRRHPGFKQS
jgi:hypothetical protein